MTEAPRSEQTEKAMGLATLAVVVFCAASGTGVGVFFQAPEIGGIVGGIVGIVIGLVVLPGLMRDFSD